MCSPVIVAQLIHYGAIVCEAVNWSGKGPTQTRRNIGVRQVERVGGDGKNTRGARQRTR